MVAFRKGESEAERGIVRGQRLARAIVHPFLLSRRRQESFTRHSQASCWAAPEGGFAAGKEGSAVGINYSEWRGLCLPFSPLF